MIVEAGHFALALALGLSLIQAVVPFWGARARDRVLMGVAGPSALVTMALVVFAFGALVAAHVQSDFSVLNVVENSHTAKPLLYRITGVWGSHEGSMLLWVLILVLFGGCVALAPGSVPERLRTDALAVQAAITTAFLVFILAASNPFRRLDPAPLQGQDLNPVLQDIGLAIHPPLLYLGYVGFSIVFAFAMAALVEGKVDAVWARAVRPWCLVAWAFLTLGIAMGSYWAYYELGWGGFWFWDPVENASLMPWLAGTALVHSIVVMEKREALKVWTMLLAILTFSLSLLGTFLVRSGVLTSVHAFAVDPARGVFILAILALFIGGSLATFAWRAPALRHGGLFAPISREGALVLNNVVLASACGTVLLGTLYPLALEAVAGDKISVGAPYFDLTFLPLAALLLVCLPVGQALGWKRGDLLAAAQRVATAAALAVTVAAGAIVVGGGGPVLAPFGVGLGVFLILGAATEIGSRSYERGRPWRVVLRRAGGLPRSAWGSALAHAGVGVTVLGLAAQAWSTETILAARPGEVVQAGPYRVTIERQMARTGPNYTEDVLQLRIALDARVVETVETSKRTFPSRQTTTTEAGIATRGLSQVYASMGEVYPDGSIGLRVYYKPLVLLIWLGAVLMAAGGGLSLSDRRFRVGAPRAAAASAGVAAAGAR